MALSRKEIIAVLLLIAAVLNVLNASLFANIVELNFSYEQVAQQVVCVGSAYICLIYAMSTWLYHSNFYRSRQEMRYVLATMLLFMIACHCVSIYFFERKLSYDKLTRCTDLSLLFTTIASVSTTISMVVSIICILLLLAALLLILIKICRSRRKQPKSIQLAYV